MVYIVYFFISYHVMSYCIVIYHFNMLELYSNLELWEKKFLRSAVVTKSNNQNIYFKTILLINHRNYEENFVAVWERCKNKICSLQVRIFKFPSHLFFLFSSHCLSLADSVPWWILKEIREMGMRIRHEFLFYWFIGLIRKANINYPAICFFVFVGA